MDGSIRFFYAVHLFMVRTDGVLVGMDGCGVFQSVQIGSNDDAHKGTMMRVRLRLLVVELRRGSIYVPYLRERG
jgi:hypothetical protein